LPKIQKSKSKNAKIKMKSLRLDIVGVCLELHEFNFDEESFY